MNPPEQTSSVLAGQSAATHTVADQPQRAFVPPNTVVNFDSVSLTYAGRRRQTEALDDFSLAIAAGERVAVVGPSGCGKSSLLALAAGLIEPTAGRVEVRDEVALMPQRDLLVPWRSAIRNAALALEAQGMPRKQAVAQAGPLFERFGLASFEHARTWELSGGMRQRVAFLRTVLTGRRVLALDEPFGALDSITRAEMQQWLLDALDDDPRTMLLVTHDVEEALALGDRIVIVTPRPGRVAAELIVERPGALTRNEWVTSLEFSALKSEALEALS